MRHSASFFVERKVRDLSQEDYFRVRLALNRKEKAELECIEYINGFGEQKTSVIKELLLLGIEVKKGTIGYSDKEKTQLASLQNKVKKGNFLDRYL